MESATLKARVAITNRNPSKAPARWWGGDMVTALGYVKGLQALGVEAEFVPCDELEATKYDLVHLIHAQSSWSRAVAGQVRGPLVVTAITHEQEPTDDLAPVVTRAAAVLCYGEREEEWYATRFPEVPRDRFLSPPPGVPEGIYAEVEEVTPTRSVFCAGRYLPVKNQLVVLQACKYLEVPVVFAGMVYEGDGEYVAALRQEAGRWEGARFLGMLKGRELWRRYREAHVHAQPSRFEPFGLATWEALACGCNAVVTERGWGGPVFAPHATVCAPEVEAVTAAIGYELSQPRDRHGFRPLTWGEAAGALVPIYRRVLGG